MNIYKNPLFYLSLVLAVIVGFQTWTFVQAAFQGPTSAFPASDVSAPLETSDIEQIKEAALWLGPTASSEVKVGPTGLCLKQNVAAGSVSCGPYWDTVSGFTSETGTLTSGKWCTSDGSVVNCTTNAPNLIETDPEVGSISTNYVPKWDGTSLETGTIYDSGDVGIGKTPATGVQLDVAGEIRTDSGITILNGEDSLIFHSSHYLTIQNQDNNDEHVVIQPGTYTSNVYSKLILRSRPDGSILEDRIVLHSSGESYFTDNLTIYGNLTANTLSYGFKDGNVILASANTERLTGALPGLRTILKEIRVYRGGTLKITWNMKENKGTSCYGSCYVYRNCPDKSYDCPESKLGGSSTNSSAYTYHSVIEDGWSPGDLVQLYCGVCSISGAKVYINNFKIRVDAYDGATVTQN